MARTPQVSLPALLRVKHKFAASFTEQKSSSRRLKKELSRKHVSLDENFPHESYGFSMLCARRSLVAVQKRSTNFKARENIAGSMHHGLIYFDVVQGIKYAPWITMDQARWSFFTLSI